MAKKEQRLIITMVNVSNGSHIQMGFGSIKLLLRHAVLKPPRNSFR